MEITLLLPCSGQTYMGALFAHIPFVVNRKPPRYLRGCNNTTAITYLSVWERTRVVYFRVETSR